MSYCSCELFVDVNECLDDMCRNGQCINTPGSFFCVCDRGFTLSPDRTSCTGKASETEKHHICILSFAITVKRSLSSNVDLFLHSLHVSSSYNGYPCRIIIPVVIKVRCLKSASCKIVCYTS